MNLATLDIKHWERLSCVLETDVETLKKKSKNRIYLDAPYNKVYFTRREAECVNQFMNKQNRHQIAFNLNLSVRTIDTYFLIIKEKLKCKYMHEVISLLEETDFKARYNDRLPNLS